MSSLHCGVPIAGAIGYRLKSHLKRYWAVDLWQTFFDTLLQPSTPAMPPPCSDLLHSFESHLQAQPGTAKTLKAELIKHFQEVVR